MNAWENLQRENHTSIKTCSHRLSKHMQLAFSTVFECSLCLLLLSKRNTLFAYFQDMTIQPLYAGNVSRTSVSHLLKAQVYGENFKKFIKHPMLLPIAKELEYCKIPMLRTVLKLTSKETLPTQSVKPQRSLDTKNNNMEDRERAKIKAI